MADHFAWMVLGSNIEPEKNLAKAVQMLAQRTKVLAVSSIWQSPPADGSSQPDYLNAAVMVRTKLSPDDILAAVITPVEQLLGRERSTVKSAPRTVDIDLALYDDRTGEYSGRLLPHPDILLRAYAAIPLAEISPEKVHPATGESLQAIAARLRHARIRRREDIPLTPLISPVE